MQSLVKVESLSKFNADNRQWLLKNISFSVYPGNVLGIIGKNDLDRSTLIKILVRIIEPTSGRVTIRGRVASLLDLGSGINRNLTGRENIYMNAAFGGIKAREIRKRFDDIVALAQLERVIDLPVSSYSLAQFLFFNLSLAVHMQANVLLIDRFIERAKASDNLALIDILMDYIHRIVRSKGSVLVVSNDIQTIKSICDFCLVIDSGEIVNYGACQEILEIYTKNSLNRAIAVTDTSNVLENEYGRLLDIRVISDRKDDIDLIKMSDKILIKIELELFDKVRIICKLDLFRSNIFILRTVINLDLVREYQPGIYEAIAHIPSNLLAEGLYSINLQIKLTNLKLNKTDLLVGNKAVEFQVLDTGEAIMTRGIYEKEIPWAISPLLEWQVFKK